jgi:hypothetical protein
MQKRSLAAVILLPFVTFGIYFLVWFVKTKGELNTKGAGIPTAWLLIVPIANIYWMWKYFEGAEKVTSGKVNGVLNFVLGFFVSSIIPMAICQSAYNELGETSIAPPADNPVAPSENTPPTV